jgi:4-diphosphocytidyl-2C-methyl-D-erythritol kinase
MGAACGAVQPPPLLARNRLWQADLRRALQKLALQLGADVPVSVWSDGVCR